MADTKKPNFADALKAQAKPAAASGEDEMVTIDLGDGEVTTLYRGKGSKRMDDAQWARLQKRAMPSSDAEKSIDGGRLLDIARGKTSVAHTLVSEEERKVLDGMSENSRYEFLRQRFKNKGYAVPASEAKLKPVAPKNSGPDDPEQVVPSTVEQKGSGSRLLEYNGDTMELGSADPAPEKGMGMGANPRNPASMIPQVAMGAIDPNGKSPTGDPNADKYTQAAIDKGNATGEADAAALQAAIPQPVDWAKNQIDQRVFGDKPLIPEGLKQLPQAAGAGMATDLGTIGQLAGDALGMPNLGKAGANLSNRAQMPLAYTDKVPVSPTDQNAAPLPVPGNPDTQPLGVPAGGGGASMSMQIPGGFSPVGADPAAMKQYREDAANARAAAEDAQFSVKAQGEAQTEAVRQAASKQMEVEAQTNNLAKLASEAKMTSVAEARRYQTAQMTVAEQARQAAATPTDPNRFWNNKNDGQKAAAVIAGALFGFSGQGQGMQWLQRIDGLVNADNQLQAQDRASKVQGLQQQAQTLGEAGRMAIANGATEAEAYIIERQAKLEGLKSYLDMTGMRLQNAQQQQQAALMSAQLGQHIADLGAQGATLAQHAADSTNQARYQNASLQMEKFKIAATMAGNGGSDKLNPQAQTTISQAEAGLGMIPELERAIGNPGGKISTALFDQISKQFPGTDANNRDIQAAFLNRTIFAGIDKSVINAADQTFLDKLQASPGLSSLRAPGAIAALKRMLTLSRNAAIQTARSVGQRTGDLQLSPDTGAASPINFTPSAR